MYDDQSNKLLKEMHTAIVGNPSLGIPGLVTRMERVEKQVGQDANTLFVIEPMVKKHEESITSARVKIASIAGSTGVISGVVFFLLDYFSKK